jgi:predicted deacylase
MTSDPILAHVRWDAFDVPATLATGTMPVRHGIVGNGRPVALLAASQHGDEGPWGTRAIRKLIEATPMADLLGTLRLLPVANPMAMAENSRESHIDREDLNMSFPGDPNGRHTERLAYGIARHILDEPLDIVIDIHGGGSWCQNCFVYRYAGGEDLAAAIGGPFVRKGHERGNTSLCGYAMARGAKAVWIEMGGAGAREEEWSQRIADGMRRALGKLGVMTPSSLPEPEPARESGASHSLRAAMPGLYLPTLREGDVGAVVAKGTEIGRLLDPVTNDVIETYVAPFDDTVCLLLRPTLAVLEGGEMVCVLSTLA